MRKILTLCVAHTDTQILLGMKKRGFGEGKWNGFGGKVQAGESIEEAARRELLEEAGVSLTDIKKRGVLEFEFQNNPEILEVHVFSGSKIEGEPKESDEMKPRWFLHKEIPYHGMWPDDKHWLPMLLSGKNFSGHFYFKDNETILRYMIREV